jgi:hypothetical protein
VAIGDARAAFFDAASTAVQLLERPELAGHWTDGSVLQQFSVTGLAGHLVRGMTTVERAARARGIEMSRLARSGREWHQLLELCALSGTLLGDPDGVYDPG